MQYTAIIVEDDPALRMIYRQVLKTMQFEVLEAVDGLSAMTLLENIAPNILFLDMLLPHINGQIILEYVLNAPHLANTMVMIATAHKQFEEFARDLPNTEFLLKPIRPDQIRDAARRAIARVKA